MADGDQDTELELDLEAQQPGDQQAEPEGDEPEEAAEDQAEQEGEPQVAAQDAVVEEVPKPSRRDTRIASLTERVRERDAELQDVRRIVEDLRRDRQQPKPAQESPEMRAQRRALMTPQEQMQEDLREAREGFTTQINQMQWQNADMTDRTAFQARCSVDPLYAKYAPKVEGKLAELRTGGGNAEREVLLKYLIGEAALERRSSKEGKREVVAAQQRVKRATTRPTNSGSDEAATRRQGESLERRLENLNI